MEIGHETNMKPKLSGVVGAIIYNMNILNKHDRATESKRNELYLCMGVWSGIKAR